MCQLQFLTTASSLSFNWPELYCSVLRISNRIKILNFICATDYKIADFFVNSAILFPEFNSNTSIVKNRFHFIFIRFQIRILNTGRILKDLLTVYRFMILYTGNDTGVQTLNTDCLPGSGSTPDFYLDTDLRHWFSTCIRILKTGFLPGTG